MFFIALILHWSAWQGANVLVGVDSLVKLADFGCSKRAKEMLSRVDGIMEKSYVLMNLREIEEKKV